MRSFVRVLISGFLSAVACGALALGGAPAASARAAAADGARVPVIVFLKYQPTAIASGTSAAGSAVVPQREQAIAAAQAPYLGELQVLGATDVKSYHLVNAFAARLPASAVQRLSASPGVAAVIPDSPITGPSPVTALAGRSGHPGLTARTRASAPARMLPAACPASGALLEPEGLALTHTDSTVPGARTARSLGYTGAGVTVGFLADGIDPSNVNLRRDGRRVITAYRDFSGEGTTAPTAGGDAFTDANAIAGQGRHVYGTTGFSALSPAGACHIRIEGTAPGASLVALKVFGRNNLASTSGYLQAIDYAVTVAQVSVLDESLGTSPFPDIASLDAVQEFNEAASAAGVTVVVASGDAGPLSTIGSPAGGLGVLSVGASTDFRFYAQTGYAAAGLFARNGWLDNNISALSSAGYTQSGGTVDMVASGDLSFASCTPDLTLYADCASFLGKASPIEMSGGTGESAAMVAGAAALVIQAYRTTHGGTAPTAATVRRALLSAADDLGAPATQQGAGMLDSLKAVEIAAWMPGREPVSQTLRLSYNQLHATGSPGAAQTWTVTVTNTGAKRQVVSLTGRTFGAAAVVAAGSVTLSDTRSRHFTNWAGALTNYGESRFTVPSGEARLNASIAWPASVAARGDGNAAVRLILIDPRGRLAADSMPQGEAGYGSAQVLHPAAGRWTAVIFSDVSAAHGTTGKVLFGATVAKYAAFGTVKPRSLALAPGASGHVTVSAVIPAAAGDSSGALVLDAGFGKTSVPVTLRGLVAATARGGGHFSGVLNGGNGRAPGEGQVAAYEFTVPASMAGKLDNVGVDVTLANDPANQVTGYLVAPGGQTMGYASNYLTIGFTSTGVPVERPGRQLSVYAALPVPGTWTLILDFTEPVPGNELADHFTGLVRFYVTRARRGALPYSPATVLARGKPVSYGVRIKNTGAAPEDVFLDARLDSFSTYTLQPQNRVSGIRVPPPASARPPEWIVPPITRTVQASAAGTAPVMFDFGPFPGDPDVPSTAGTTASGAFPLTPLLTPVSQGLWSAAPSRLGPYPAAGARAATATMSMSATTRTFDTSLSSGPGDFWRFAVQPLAATASYNLFVINPGQTRIIAVTIDPAQARGTVVRGVLWVDDFVESLQFLSGSTIVAVPYAYTVG